MGWLSFFNLSFILVSLFFNLLAYFSFNALLLISKFSID
ncbi:putative membrane protein [Helicobacter pylori Hp H-45]|uniref:Putative membrane protein n=1 Tax=Helicobacter pylori Hp H-45 TaxID=992050 RepID=J0M3F7_HELPX|nr:putative membrane protein [Helicobacter pylori Hp H-45]